MFAASQGGLVSWEGLSDACWHIEGTSGGLTSFGGQVQLLLRSLPCEWHWPRTVITQHTSEVLSEGNGFAWLHHDAFKIDPAPLQRVVLRFSAP